jgi:hypothetical protein
MAATPKPVVARYYKEYIDHRIVFVNVNKILSSGQFRLWIQTCVCYSAALLRVSFKSHFNKNVIHQRVHVVFSFMMSMISCS